MVVEGVHVAVVGIGDNWLLKLLLKKQLDMLSSAGKTVTVGDPDLTEPAIKLGALVPRAERGNILLASARITEGSIFTNGLFQNIYFIYKMLDIIGYNPYFLFNEKDKPAELPTFMGGMRIVTLEDIVKSPLKLHAYIEIGMSIDPSLRRFLKMLGAKAIKIYLGNILNIDIETPTYYHNMHFAHHVVGEMDEIWVSPHYEMHREYAAVLNHVPIEKSRIAAYVWDPYFISKGGTRMLKWRPKDEGTEDTFVIMEPNISFQKSSLIPLLMLEAFARANPNWKGKIVVGNGERLRQIPYSLHCFLSRLEIFKRGLITLEGRLDMPTIMERYPSCIPICHNYNNEYNYMIFEYLWGGFPVIHNAGSWRSAGYYYDAESIEEGVKAVVQALQTHADNLNSFLATGKVIIERHSIWNPKVQEAWKQLLA